MAYWSVGKVLNVIDNNYTDVVFIFSVRDFSVGKQLLIVSGKLIKKNYKLYIVSLFLI